MNAQGGHHRTALQSASSGGHKAIAKLLMEIKANINVEGECHGNAL